jgi:tetratricopeptide (TPR) repeat protein
MLKLFLLISFCATGVINAQNTVQSIEKISEILVEQGLVKAGRSDWNGAIEEYSNAISKNVKNASAYYNRAIARNNLKDYRGAITDFSKAIYFNSDDAIVSASYLGRGKCYLLLGNKNNACLDFNKASGLGNQDATAAAQDNCN